MNHNQCGTVRRALLRACAVALLGIVGGATTQFASAQTVYSYFPTGNVADGRFLSVTGFGINTLAQPLSIKLASPGVAASIEIGFFDGETGGQWDQGVQSLTFTLCADSAGDGSGTFQVAQWLGSSMTDNNWYNVTVNNVIQAKAATGDYFYVLKVTNPNPASSFWSNFKIRTNGTVLIPRRNPFAYTAAINSNADAAVIYPNFPTLTPTTYDGSWSFYLFVPESIPFLDVWDGDFDYGSYDCSDNDTDDSDTPNSGIPVWAVGTAAVSEAIAGNGIACRDAAGTLLGGNTTSNPADDSRIATLRREPNAQYEVILPNGTAYANTNPSGNLEWEQFRLDTDPLDNTVMDYHVASLPAGFYEVRIVGVDMSNLNAWRFPFDASGVDSTGEPVPPILPSFVDGSVEGTIFYDANSNGTLDAGEPGVPSVTITMFGDYNNDGVIDASFLDTTDDDGKYKFADLRGGKYKAEIDMSTLSDDVLATGDFDGVATPNAAAMTLVENARAVVAPFGYKRTSPPGTRTRGYWVNHPENWPVESLTLGGVTYSKSEALGILKRPTKGDKSYSMAAQLIATKLNLAGGSEGSCIVATVAAADAWLDTYALNTKVRDWNGGESAHNTLDSYNNGHMCAGHMD